MSESKIAQFYSNKNVLITGASGFLGKVILWKLIDNIKDIGKIYVLLRSKNSVSAEKRLIALLKSKPFCFKYDYAELLQKVVAIESDITADDLALSQSDRSLLEDNVNVVLHSAASVKFDAPLKDNLRDNYYGTRSIVMLCNTIKNLNAFVHVSTAYSNCQAQDIEEKIQPLKKPLDEAVQMIEALSDDSCNLILDKILEGRPNTYTYTKALAEHFVAKHEGQYPISIVRPSIVISAHEDPCSGWVDNVNGIGGLGCLAAIGMLRTIDWNYYATSDMVPVDLVANNIICAARHVAVNSPKKMVIYNMTSGNANPISWGVFFEMLRETATKTPPTKIVRPMIHSPKYRRANRLQFLAIKFFSELLFAYLVDTIISLFGYKRIILKITKKMHHGYEILKPFTTNQWNFCYENVMELSESLTPYDKEKYKFDMRGFDWGKQAVAVWHGGRTFLLKEEPTEESYKIGLSRQRLVTIVHYGLITAFMTSMAFIGYTGVGLLKAF